MSIKNIICLLFSVNLAAQVVTIPSGCPTAYYSSLPTLTAPYGSMPIGNTIFEVNNNINGGIVFLLMGLSNYHANPWTNLQSPLDLGFVNPYLSGCNLISPAIGSQVWASITTTVTFNVNVIVYEPIIFQAMVIAPNPAGFTLTNALEYWAN